MLVHLIIAAFVTTSLAHESAESEFIKTCPPSQCGSIPIRFPLRLQSDNPRCSLDGLDLTCSLDNRTLHLPAFPQYKITNISYAYHFLTLDVGSISLSNFETSPCPLQNLSSFVHSLPYYSSYIAQTSPANFVRCSKKISPVSNSYSYHSIAGPIQSCHEKDKYFVYVADIGSYMDVLGHDCEVFGDVAVIPQFIHNNGFFYAFADDVYEFMAQKELKLNFSWYEVEESGHYYCSECEQNGKYCGFDWGTNQTFCLELDHGSNVLLIAGTSISGFVILLVVSFILLYTSRRSAKEKETWLKW